MTVRPSEPLPAAGATTTRSPMRDVALTLHQGAHSLPLGTADAAGRETGYGIAWSVRVPADARPGIATLLAGAAEQEIMIVG
jgi:hypothetical protein